MRFRLKKESGSNSKIYAIAAVAVMAMLFLPTLLSAGSSGQRPVSAPQKTYHSVSSDHDERERKAQEAVNRGEKQSKAHKQVSSRPAPSSGADNKVLQPVTVPKKAASKASTGKTTPIAGGGMRKSHGQLTPMVPKADRAQTDKVFLEHADRLHYDRAQAELEQLPEYQVLSGNVKFRKGGMFMFCDSAYFYDSTNSVDAFGNVRMEQGDTLFVYADELNYNGLTELAVLYADFGKKVKLQNRDVVLETDIFNYDMAQELGYYNIGGVLYDAQNRLTSVEGEYNPRTKYAYFNYDVHLTSLRNKDNPLYINTDSLTYNTATHVAELVSPSEIINADGKIYSSNGVYNTSSGVADLYHRSLVVTNKGNTLTGDTLFYDRNRQYGEAFGNMVLTDSARQSSLQGDYGYYDEVRDSVFVTGRALAKEYSKGDTLYLHGDTINAYLDLVDSTHVTNVFHKVRFYRYDLQGLCDSLSMTERDSILYMYRSPIVWSGERQIYGNIINVHMNDSTVDWARLPQSGVMAEHIAEDCYNQLSGTDMTAWFNDSTVRRLYVEGNVQLIMFPMESDSTYNKFAYVESSYMDAYFLANSIEGIHFWPETTTKITPLYLAKRNSYFLPKFKWYETLRPVSPAAVFVVPEEMVELMRNAEPIAPAVNKLDSKDASRPNGKAPASKDDAVIGVDGVPSVASRDAIVEKSVDEAVISDESAPLPSDSYTEDRTLDTGEE